MDIRKVLLISKLALVMVLSFVTVRTMMVLQNSGEIFEPAKAVGTDNVSAVETTSSRGTSLKDCSAIIQQNIFGGVHSSLKASNSLSGNSVGGLLWSAEKELGLALLGTVSGSPVVSRAIIKNLETHKPGLYRTGEVVADASIESIEKDAVILVHSGQRKVLKLNIAGGHNENKSQPISSKSINKKSEAVKASLQDEEAPIEVRTKIKHVEAILKKAVIEPYIVNGKIEGLRITDLEKISIAKDLGLKNGDVVRGVNGHRLTSKQKAYQVFKKARTQPTMSIELLRGDKTKKLSFNLR